MSERKPLRYPFATLLTTFIATVLCWMGANTLLSFYSVYPKLFLVYLLLAMMGTYLHISLIHDVVADK
ncbi:MAG: hypothetical protein DRG35_01435 [Deltaproteobacteria bacterium]|nr:MAG: hypothetical protein DRG35_01435 [Deltaproteobacteria bacterium]